MDKGFVDKIIADYMEKIFGFALSKTMNTDKAEELAARITFDVYISLLKIDVVHNVNGYIYRVAQNVYARFIDEEVRGRYIAFDDIRTVSENDFTVDFEKNETYIRLRREVSYLGKTQREIIVLHYFMKLKQYEIAKLLNLPLGTVKWHLHDARNQIREGLKMREAGTLGMTPIKFVSMGHNGFAGPEGKDTSHYLAKLLTQNIAYAAYFEAKSIREIAEELGVPSAFVEDEVVCLEDNGFMDKVASGKYLTNIVISIPTKEIEERKHELYKKYAKLVCEKYIPLVIDFMRDNKTLDIYTPEDDADFLLWSVVTFACIHKFKFKKAADDSKYRVKRKDGGEYIAHAMIDTAFNVNFDRKLYIAPNNMTRGGEHPVYSWQLNSFYDSREVSWRDNLYEDYCRLYDLIIGKLVKESANADHYKRLYDKGYIMMKGDTEYVNMVVTTASYEDFIKLLPDASGVLKEACEDLDREIYEIEKTQYPPHMQDLSRIWSTNCMADQNFATYVLEQLASNGILKPLTDAQKHAVNTIMFCDVLPK